MTDTQTLYAVDRLNVGEIAFTTSGWTTDRAGLHDAVAAEIDVLTLHELLSRFALKSGVEIGTAERSGAEWSVEINDYFRDTCGYDQ